MRRNTAAGDASGLQCPAGHQLWRNRLPPLLLLSAWGVSPALRKSGLCPKFVDEQRWSRPSRFSVCHRSMDWLPLPCGL